jgi:molecular chaperone DnaK
VVGFTPAGERLVGQFAKVMQCSTPRTPFIRSSVLLDARYSEVQEEIKNVLYKVVPGPNDAVRFMITEKEYTPEEIYADSAPAHRRRTKYLGEKSRTGNHGSRIF